MVGVPAARTWVEGNPGDSQLFYGLTDNILVYFLRFLCMRHEKYVDNDVLCLDFGDVDRGILI